MLRCSKEAFAACPTSHICGRREDSTFTEGSDCDKFNQAVAKSCKPVITNGDRIRAMSNEELVAKFWEFMPDDEFCTGSCNEQRECNTCRLAWLQQPVKEESE